MTCSQGVCPPVLLIFNYVTPNKLFKDTKKLENTKVLKDPEGKEENSFVPF